MKRRAFIVALSGAAAWPLVARGQVSPKRPLIAWLSGLTQTLSSTFVGNFLQGMQELGYIEGWPARNATGARPRHTAAHRGRKDRRG